MGFEAARSSCGQRSHAHAYAGAHVQSSPPDTREAGTDEVKNTSRLKKVAALCDTRNRCPTSVPTWSARYDDQTLTKNEIARRLVAFSITLSPSTIKHTSHADLLAQLEAAEAAADAKADATRAEVAASLSGEDTIDLDQDPTPDEPKLLTEDECAKAADAWINAKDGRLARYGLAEATSMVHDGRCTITTTNFHLIEVNAATGKAKYAGVSPAREMVPARRASNVVKLPRKSSGINLSPRPADQIKTCRAGTVQADLIDALHGGATMWELEGVAPKWTTSSIRSAFSWDVHRVKGYGIRTELMTPRQAYDAGHEAHCENMLGTEQEHEPIIPVYFLVLPAGMDAPLPHTLIADRPVKAAANVAPKKRATKE